MVECPAYRALPRAQSPAKKLFVIAGSVSEEVKQFRTTRRSAAMTQSTLKMAFWRWKEKMGGNGHQRMETRESRKRLALHLQTGAGARRRLVGTPVRLRGRTLASAYGVVWAKGSASASVISWRRKSEGVGWPCPVKVQCPD